MLRSQDHRQARRAGRTARPRLPAGRASPGGHLGVAVLGKVVKMLAGSRMPVGVLGVARLGRNPDWRRRHVCRGRRVCRREDGGRSRGHDAVTTTAVMTPAAAKTAGGHDAAETVAAVDDPPGRGPVEPIRAVKAGDPTLRNVEADAGRRLREMTRSACDPRVRACTGRSRGRGPESLRLRRGFDLRRSEHMRRELEDRRLRSPRSRRSPTMSRKRAKRRNLQPVTSRWRRSLRKDAVRRRRRRRARLGPSPTPEIPCGCGTSSVWSIWLLASRR